MNSLLRRIALPVGLMLLAASAAYLINLNMYITGTDQHWIQIAEVSWVILTVAAIIAAVPSVRVIVQPWLLGIVLAGSFIVCNVFYLMLSFGGDLHIARRLDHVNEQVRNLALYGAGMTIFLVLCIASLIAILSYWWSLNSSQPAAKGR